MSDDQQRPNDFEETLRALAKGVMGSIDRLSEIDLDDMARSAGIDPDRARDWLGGAGQWLRVQVEHVDLDADADVATSFGTAADDPWSAADPHPLDVPTHDQGVALAALDSGRWTLEPGTSAIVSTGDGPGPHDALGLVRELRVRDWVGRDGELTLAGRHALERWLRAADAR